MSQKTRRAVRCSGTTKAGNPCRSYAMAGSDYCRAHQPDLTPGGSRLSHQQRRIHSLYGRFLTADDLVALDAAGREGALDDEIGFTRAIVRRLAELIGEADGIEEHVRLGDSLFRGAGRVAHLLKAQQTLSEQAADRLARALEHALNELKDELGTEL